MSSGRANDRPILVCFDGSDDAATAIAHAGAILTPRPAVVLTVWEPVASWTPYDPATILTAPLSRVASDALRLNREVRDLAQTAMERGVKLAGEAGFPAQGRLEEGKPWHVVCAVADELGAEPIVMGARGLGRVESALLGSVSTAVVFHTRRAVLVVPHTADEQRPPGGATR